MGKPNKLIFFLFVTNFLIFEPAQADSFRCGRALVKAGESSNALIKKCGKPARKFSAKEQVGGSGQRSNLSVTNWVYERHGKKDMIVSVRNGSVVKIRRD